MFQDHSVRLFRQQPWNAKLVLRHDSFFFSIVILRRGFILFHFQAWVKKEHYFNVYLPCYYSGSRISKKQQYK